jgi:hypothetical protein
LKQALAVLATRGRVGVLPAHSMREEKEICPLHPPQGSDPLFLITLKEIEEFEKYIFEKKVGEREKGLLELQRESFEFPHSLESTGSFYSDNGLNDSHRRSFSELIFALKNLFPFPLSSSSYSVPALSVSARLERAETAGKGTGWKNLF